MLVDTHCHLNMLVKKKFDIILTPVEIENARQFIDQAQEAGVTTIINVGTSMPESTNCILLAKKFPSVYATVGIHPNDCTEQWRSDLIELTKLVREKEKNRIVGIGEIGLDFHYPDYNKMRQLDAFKAQIDLALEHDLAIVIHSRDAYDETLRALESFGSDITRAVTHCFSYDDSFAQEVISKGFKLGIGGTITYPKNSILRSVVQSYGVQPIVLETDAPFLPIQSMRGQQNRPCYIKDIALYVAEITNIPLSEVSTITTRNAQKLFKLAL